MNPVSAKRKKDSGVGAKPPVPPKAALRHEVAEVYRRAIFDAAERVFGANGFAEAKMTEIAEGAGLAAGSLYNHFASKEDIFRALAEHRSGAFLEALNETASLQGDVEHVLTLLVQRTFAELDAHGAFFALLMQGGGMGTHAQRACGPLFERNHQRFLQAFESVCQRAAANGQLAAEHAPAELAAVLAGAAHGLAMAWLLTGRQTRITERAPYLVRLFLNGAKQR